MDVEIPAEALNSLGETTAAVGGEAANAIASNPGILITGILLIAAAILIFFFIKKLIVNSVLGFVGWILFIFFVGVDQSLLIPSLVISVIFGLAGVGVLLVLTFFGVV